MTRAGCVLGGYVGFGNAGDELIARAVRDAAPNVPWTTLGMDSSRWNPLSLSLLFRSSKALVYGGGELFQARTSRRSLWYYAGLPGLARACGARFVAYGMGLDPALSGRALATAVAALDRADRLWFRDEESLALYQKSGGKVPASFAPDAAWTGEISSQVPAGELRRILWIPRRPMTLRRLQTLSSRAGGDAAFLFLHPDQDGRDFAGLPSVEEWSSLDELPSLLKGHDAVVSMRYHGVLLAALAGKPVVALAAHGKVASLAESLGAIVLPAEASAAQVSLALQSAVFRAPAVHAKALALGAAAARGLEEFRAVLETL